MAEQSPEQILLHEVKRLTRPSSMPQSAGVVAQTLASAAPRLVSTPRAQSTTSSRQVNKGYTLPVPEATQPTQSTGGSTLGTIGSTALKVFTSGLGLMPLISGLAGLFGGGHSAPPPPLVPYAMPQSVHIDAANSAGSSYQLADQSQSGQPRAYGQTQSASSSPANSPAASAAGPQIVVNVSAMDSQSFMDRSQDIAQAVRQAMLNMHSINDVVSEL